MGVLPILMPTRLHVSVQPVCILLQSIMGTSCLYLLHLLEGSPAFRAFAIDPRPVLDALPVEVVLAGGEDGFAALFVPHQADRAHLLALGIFLDVLELIELAVVGHADLVLNGVLVIVGLNQGQAPLVLLPLLVDPPLNLEASEGEKEVLPADEFMHKLYEDHEVQDEMKQENDADEGGEPELAAEVAVERVRFSLYPEHEG